MTKSENTKDEQQKDLCITIEPLTEGSYVYTDLGIEQVHWCEVNGEKELVTPKGYILGDVPDFDTYARLVKNDIALELGKIKLQEENAKLKGLLKKHRDTLARTLALCIDLNFGEKQKNKLADDIAEIDQVLGEE